MAVAQPKDIRYASISSLPGDSPPYLLENRTIYPFLVSQRRLSEQYRLPPQSTRGFCWESPTAEWVLVLLVDTASDQRMKALKGMSYYIDLKEVATGKHLRCVLAT